jgi:hypothetical protein
MQVKTFSSSVWWWGSADLSLVKPLVWVGSPEWVRSSRFPWDRYIDTVWSKGVPLEYQNPNGSWNTWRRIMQEVSA